MGSWYRIEHIGKLIICDKIKMGRKLCNNIYS